jgi:hypothetical protein
MAIPAEDVLNTARMFLNDANQQLWDDPTLMPMLQRAHQELQVQLRQRAAPVMKTQSAQVVNAGQQLITGLADIVSPIKLIESAPFGLPSLMTEADPLPLIAPGPTLQWWNWDGSEITLIGATTTREVLVYYWRQLPVPKVGTDNILILDGEMWLAPRTAAIAWGVTGADVMYQALAQEAQSRLEQVIRSNRGRAPQDAGVAVRP